MQKHSSKSVNDFETFFLLLFTKEIIRNTNSYKNLIIKSEVKSFVQKKENTQPISRPISPNLKQVLTNKVNSNFKRVSVLKKEVSPFQDFFAKEALKKSQEQKQTYSIPESQLPQTFNYLKPSPSSVEINLKKLNPLIKDPLVQIIECNGPNEKIIVSGGMGRKNTGITLTKEEISEVIQSFSDSTKIPTSEGVFKVVFGKLILSAIISEVVDSRFVIKKMTPSIPGR